MRRVLLISNKVFTTGVSNYNYFARRFRELGWNSASGRMSWSAAIPTRRSSIREMPFNFGDHRREIER